MLRAQQYLEKAYSERNRGNIEPSDVTVRAAHRLVEAGVSDPVVLIATVLYNVLADTSTTAQMIFDEFGSYVSDVLTELLLDSGLDYSERQTRIKKVGGLSVRAQLVECAVAQTRPREDPVAPAALKS